MKISLGTLAMAGALALVIDAAPTLASAADFFGIPIPGSAAPLPPPLDLSAPPPVAPAPPPDALAGAYVPMPPPGMVTYPAYQAAYPNTGCRGAYWARKPIFNADGLLIGYTRPQFMCPQWY